ncbi:hypothetical protein D3C76_1464830 [compost metagenome]
MAAQAKVPPVRFRVVIYPDPVLPAADDGVPADGGVHGSGVQGKGRQTADGDEIPDDQGLGQHVPLLFISGA